jgi:NTP pyrophosphatase (non-canonical NTP hydrolase)
MAGGPADRDGITLEDLSERLRRFRDARDWRKFHSPQNLAAALSVEAGEVLEHFLWPSSGSGSDRDEGPTDEIAEELADVAIYLLYLADVLEIDLARTITAKIDSNEDRFPVEAVRGRPRLP